MELGSMTIDSHDEQDYSNYDNRPIRPMDQDALNEVLARLPILIDDDESLCHGDPLTSLKNRRQPVLAYSTRRKNNSVNHQNQSVLNINSICETPMSIKRKFASGTTPTIVVASAKKTSKRLGYQQELVNLKEEKQLLEEEKNNSQQECIRLKKLHEAELEAIKDEHQQAINQLMIDNQVECDALRVSMAQQQSLLDRTKVELANLRDDHTLILLEKETLSKMVAEYQLFQEQVREKLSDYETTIKKLREEISQMKENHQPKREVNRSNSNNNRPILKENTVDRLRNGNNPALTNKDLTRSKTNAKVAIVRGINKDELLKTPSLSINTHTNKSSSSVLTSKSLLMKSKSKSNAANDADTKSISSIMSLEKPMSVFAARSKPKLAISK